MLISYNFVQLLFFIFLLNIASKSRTKLLVLPASYKMLLLYYEYFLCCFKHGSILLFIFGPCDIPMNDIHEEKLSVHKLLLAKRQM